MNSEPIRQELVEMSVKFLSHPTVKRSSIVNQRSFLENKGLTSEEVDEAFRRVPDPSPGVMVRQDPTLNQDVRSKSFTNIQQQATSQSPQPQPASPIGVLSKVATSPTPRFHWSRVFAILGLLATSGAGTAILLKKFILPRLKIWIHKVVFKEHDDGGAMNPRESWFKEVTEAARVAADAAVNVEKVSLGMLNAKNEEKRFFEALAIRLDTQVAEMKSIRNTIWKLEVSREAALTSKKQLAQLASRNGPSNIPWEIASLDDDAKKSVATAKSIKANGVSSFNVPARPSPPPASVRPSIAQHPKSFMEIMAMIQRGEIPPGVKDINDSPPNPNQSLPSPHMAPRTKPWEVAQGQSQNNYTHAVSSQVQNEGSKTQDHSSTSQLNGNNSVPWWQHDNVKITELESDNAVPS